MSGAGEFSDPPAVSALPDGVDLRTDADTAVGPSHTLTIDKDAAGKLHARIDGRGIAGVFEISIGADYREPSTVTIKLRGHRVPIVDRARS